MNPRNRLLCLLARATFEQSELEFHRAPDSARFPTLAACDLIDCSKICECRPRWDAVKLVSTDVIELELRGDTKKGTAEIDSAF